MTTLIKTSALVLAGLSITATVGPDTAPMAWNVDDAHTEINFTVTHFFTPVTGSFQDFDIDLFFDAEDVSNSRVSVQIAVASVDTGKEKRDNHLLSGDFFDAETYPYITFESQDFRSTGNGEFVAAGDLTIKGVSREVELPLRLLGVKQIPAELQQMLGGVTEVVSFAGGTTVDRGDYGVGTGSWAATLVVGGDVDIDIAVEANRS
jgi:polyisoprenoid-binding protein YceI